MAAEIRAATVPVVDDLERVAVAPDVIHGHHHTVTLEALLRFPGVPAIFFVHDWSGWPDEPLRFPRVALYAPVDATNADRVVLEHGIPPERVRLVLNAVDLERFRPRDALPPRPARALVFSNYASEADLLPAVREACRRTGLELAVVGEAAGNPASRPEDLLGGFDVVFAKARCALEALAVGAAVVLCHGGSMGPLVTAADFDRLRSLNFGRRAIDRRLTVEGLVAEIRRYDAADAARVAERVRAEASLEGMLDRLVALYEEARAIPLAAGAGTEAAATASYLRRWAPQFHELRAAHRQAREQAVQLVELDAERSALAARLALVTAELDPLGVQGADGDPQRVAAELATVRERLAAADAELADTRSELRHARELLERVTGTFTWRWRERLLRWGFLRAVHRWWRSAGRRSR